MRRGTATRPEVMTPAQVADYFQVHKLTVYRYIRAGELPAVRLERALRILKIDVDEFLRAHQVASAQRRPDTRRSDNLSAPQSLAESSSAERHRDPSAVAIGSRIELRSSRDNSLAINPLEWIARGLREARRNGRRAEGRRAVS
jgi:excisionase family DNA binding protein